MLIVFVVVLQMALVMDPCNGSCAIFSLVTFDTSGVGKFCNGSCKVPGTDQMLDSVMAILIAPVGFWGGSVYDGCCNGCECCCKGSAVGTQISGKMAYAWVPVTDQK